MKFDLMCIAFICVTLTLVTSCSQIGTVLTAAETVGKKTHETRQRVDRDKMTASRWAMCGVGLDVWLEELNKKKDLDEAAAILCGGNAEQLFDEVNKKE